MTLALGAAYRARLAQARNVPPLEPRVPLWAGDARIGSVEAHFFARLALPAGVVREHAGGWQVLGDATRSLDAIAHAMRHAGLARKWRDEQLAVTDESGRTVASIERAAVRALGITTFAVHMAGVAPDGRHWVQQRSFKKPNDPGLWDTLMGGLIAAGESLELALERETLEEAGLRTKQLQRVAHGGRMLTHRPSRDGACGYIVEWIDWFRCVVPDGVVPSNLDGEVERFELIDSAQLVQRLESEEFTLEAALVLTESAR